MSSCVTNDLLSCSVRVPPQQFPHNELSGGEDREELQRGCLEQCLCGLCSHDHIRGVRIRHIHR